jgi:hypothetical protein
MLWEAQYPSVGAGALIGEPLVARRHLDDAEMLVMFDVNGLQADRFKYLSQAINEMEWGKKKGERKRQ